jgi:hypothetical protein
MGRNAKRSVFRVRVGQNSALMAMLGTLMKLNGPPLAPWGPVVVDVRSLDVVHHKQVLCGDFWK